MRNKNTDITRSLAAAPVVKTMLRLSIPAVCAQIVNLLYNIVDRIYIGHMQDVGSTALTGVGLCFPVIYLIAAFTMLIAQGGAPRAAICMGKNDNTTAEKILGSCLTTLIITGLLLSAAFMLWGEKLLWLFGASEDTIVYSLSYMKIYAAGSVFVMLSLGMNLFITTQGFTKISMLTVVIGAVLNIILDPVFIFTLNMGVKGAATATVISQAVSGTWALGFLISRKSKLRIKRENLKPDYRILLPCIALGLAPFIMQSTEALINISFNSSLQKFGGDTAVGTMTIASTVMQFIWIPAQGLGQGAQPLMSYNYGAGNAKRCKETFRALLVSAGILLMTSWAVIEIFPQTFMRIFTNDETLLAQYGYVRLYMALMGMFFIQSAVQQTFTAIGKAKASLFIACLRKIILLIPLIFILPNFFDNKIFAVFLAEPVSDTISIITSAIVFAFVFSAAMRDIEKKVL